MKQLSFFHPKSSSLKVISLSILFVFLMAMPTWAAATVTWQGANGNNGTRWHVASNWSTNALPTAADDVIIPNVNTAPIITTAAVCNSITINTGALLTINSSGNLAVSGSWINNGTFTQNSGTVTFTGDNNAEITGNANTTFTSLKVNKGNGKSAEIHVNGKGKVDVNNSLSIDNGLLKINTGGTLNLMGTAAAPSSGIELNGGTYTVNGKDITPLIDPTGITRTATTTGNWSSPSTWSGGVVPADGDDVIIAGGNTITVDVANAGCNNIQLGVSKNGTGKLSFPQSSSLLTVNGNLTLGDNSNGSNAKSGSLDMASGGTLKVGGALTAPYLGTWTQGAGTIEYNGAAQTVYATTYNNLTLSGSGAKTTTGVTVNGILSMEETATASVVPTYGTTATLQYNTSTARTTGPEWKTPFTATGGVIIKNSGMITLGAAKVLNTDVTLNINSGATLNPAGYTHTISGGASLVVNGTLDFSNAFGMIKTGTSGTSTLTMGPIGLIKTIDPNGLGPVTNGSFTTNGGSWTTNLGSLGTVEYNRSAADDQPITAGTYNKLIISGTALKTFSSAVTAANLTIKPEASATISSGTVSVTTAFLIESSATGTGSLKVEGTGSLSGSGSKSVQRYLPSENWHLISSPVSGQTLNEFATSNGIQEDIPTSTYDIGSYDEGNTRWDYTKGSDGFAAAKGYSTERTLAAGPGVATFSGTGIYTTNQSATLTKNKDGWNCIGNPFTSAIYASGTTSDFFDINGSNLDPNYTLYLFDNISGQYEALTRSGTKYIAVGQGFMVKAIAAGSAAFNTNMQVHLNGATFKNAEIPWPTVTLKAESDDFRCNTVVNFNEAMTKGLDPTYDAGMFKGNPNIALYSKLVSGDNPVDFSVQSLPPTETGSYRIPIGLDLPGGGEVSFTAKTLNLSNSNKVILEDTETQTFTDLGAEGAKYTTVVAAKSNGTGRFYLHTGQNSVTSVSNLAKQDFTVFTRDRMIYINGEADGNTDFSLYNIEGKQFTNIQAKKINQNMIDATGFPTGIYLLRINHNGRQQVAKLVLMN